MNIECSILFRCDGAPDIGLGHIVRCLALADELKKHNIDIFFAMRKGPLGIKMVEEKGYEVIVSQEESGDFAYGEWLKQCVGQTNAQAIIFDVRDGLSKDVVKKIREDGVLIVDIDDPEDKRLEADLAFYPPVPQVKRMDWTGFTGKLYSGWEWVVLRPEFAEWRKKHGIASDQCTISNNVSFHDQNITTNDDISLRYTPCNTHKTLNVLVTMGGSDPAGLTLKAVEALNMLPIAFKATIVLGPGFVHKESLKALLQEVHYEYNILENVSDMVPVMAQADLAVASFGVTAYELAAMGVPAIYICLTADHEESASAFVDAGMALTLGQYANVGREEISIRIKELFKKSTFYAMSHNTSTHMDGLGTIRISNLLEGRLEERR